MNERHRLLLNTGNLLELAGAGVGCYAVSLLWGAAVALLVAGVLLVAGAELVYDSHAVRLPLPRRPHPVRKARLGVADRRMRFKQWRAVRKALKEHDRTVS